MALAVVVVVVVVVVSSPEGLNGVDTSRARSARSRDQVS